MTPSQDWKLIPPNSDNMTLNSSSGTCLEQPKIF